MTSKTLAIRMSGGGVSDTLTVAKVSDGAGTSSPEVLLSNESITFSAPASGYTIPSFTGSSCGVTAYIGSLQMTYAASGANTFSCTNSSTGITVGAGTGSGNTYTVPEASAMSAETATTTIVTTIRGAAGTTVATINSVISYSLSRAGKTYSASITGGIRNITYDADGANPTPSQTAFSVTLYENGSPVVPTYA